MYCVSLGGCLNELPTFSVKIDSDPFLLRAPLPPAVTCAVSALPEEHRHTGLVWEIASRSIRVFSVLARMWSSCVSLQSFFFLLSFTQILREGGDDFIMMFWYSALCLVRPWIQVCATAHGALWKFSHISTWRLTRLRRTRKMCFSWEMASRLVRQWIHARASFPGGLRTISTSPVYLAVHGSWFGFCFACGVWVGVPPGRQLSGS